MVEIDPDFTIYVDDKFYQHTDGIINKNSYQYFGKKYDISNMVLFTITVFILKQVFLLILSEVPVIVLRMHVPGHQS